MKVLVTQMYTFSAFEKFNVDYSHTVYSREMILVHTLGIAMSYKLKVIPDFYHHLLTSYYVYKCTLFSMGGGVSRLSWKHFTKKIIFIVG